MLTKADMEDIWRNKPVGYLRNNFCGAKSNVLKKYQVTLTATKHIKLIPERTLPPVWAKPGSNIMYLSDAHEAINALYKEAVEKYGVLSGENITIAHTIKQL